MFLHTLQTAWQTLYDDLADSIETQQEEASDKLSLQKGIDKFKKTEETTARQNVGLNWMIDQEWTQEYGAE